MTETGFLVDVPTAKLFVDDQIDILIVIVIASIRFYNMILSVISAYIV